MVDPPQRQKVPSQLRATMMAAGVFAGVMALGVVYVGQRKAIRLSEPRGHADWSVRFRVPSGWRDESPDEPLRSQMQVFFGPRGERCIRARRLVVARDTAPETVCHTILAQYALLWGAESVGDLRASPMRLGGWPAALIDWTPGMGSRRGSVRLFLLSVVVGGGKSAGEAYTIELQSSAHSETRDRALWNDLTAALELPATDTATGESADSEGN